MWLFLPFLAVPLIEIALFIQVGGAIGLFPTLLIVVATAVLGTFLVRTQGTAALGNLRSSFNELRDPTEPLAHGAMILFSGALLLTPGFFTDAVGFALLVPGVRTYVYNAVRSRVKVQGFSTEFRRDAADNGPKNTIDGEFIDISADKRPTHEPSGRTKH